MPMQVLVRSRKGADTGYPVTADAADMWSAGVLLFTVAAKQPPFTSSDGSVRDLSKQHSAWVGWLLQAAVVVRGSCAACTWSHRRVASACRKRRCSSAKARTPC